MTMTINGSGTITGLPAGGLPDATIQQADLATNVAGNGPAFNAYRETSTQSISSSTWTRVQLNTELFDTNSNFDNATNYRFTPTVAGYYQFSGAAHMAGSISRMLVCIFKNGSDALNGCDLTFPTAVGQVAGATAGVLYMNGATDYVELYVYAQGTSLVVDYAKQLTNMSGAFVRAA